MKLLLTSIALAGTMFAPIAYAQQISDITATVSITQWVADDVQASTDAAIARFAVKYPNVTIDASYIPIGSSWGEYGNSYVNQVASGNTPDIIGSAIEGFATISSTGTLIDLGAYAANDAGAQEVMAGIDENMLNGMRTKATGELNFFPTQWNNIVMYYNKDMFDAAGVDYPSDDWTWDDFLETAKALTLIDDDGNVTQYGYFVPGFNFGLMPWYMTNSASLLDENWEESAVDTPEFRETLEFLGDLILEHEVAPAFEGGVGTERFTADQVAMFSAGHWPVPAIKAAGMTNVGVQHMPMNTVQTTVFGIGGLAITNAAENPDLAWAFVAELTGDDYQQDLVNVGAAIPSMRSFATTPEFLAFPDNSDIFYGSAATALPVPSPANFAQMEEIHMRNLGTYLNGEVSLDDTISNFDRELARAMSRLR